MDTDKDSNLISNAISAPKSAEFWFIYLGLDCLGAQLVFTIQL